MLTMGQIEDGLQATLARLEELTDTYAEVTDAAAAAEADYRLAYWRVFLDVKASSGAARGASDKVAEGRATIAAEEQFRIYKTTAASAESVKAALRTHTSRLDALRTMAANVRNQT
jgi:hypothetical protein